MSRILNCALLLSLVVVLLAGCTTKESRVRAPDPLTFGEITVRQYWEFRSNLMGKVISEEKIEDGTFVYGRYLLKRTLSEPKVSLEELQEIYASSMTDFRVDSAKLAATGAFLDNPFTAEIADVKPARDEQTVTVQKGSADGVRAGYYAFAHEKVDEDLETTRDVMFVRYMYEDIGVVIALLEVTAVDEHTSTLKVLGFRPGRSLKAQWNALSSSYIQFGFPRKSKFNILYNIPDAVQSLVDTDLWAREDARQEIARALVQFYDGDKATVAEMIARLSSDDVDMRTVTVEALRGVTGQEFGYESEASPEDSARAIESWREWWDKNRRTFGLKPPERKKTQKSKDHLYGDWRP
ncbi:MAG: hypothetical protein ABIH04_09725 [Planctomycetota bacterium]